ncbi:unnamed protein product [Rotaria magnacalcarata]|uniref:Uncharacterized protein n=3 Tax=Rotaria magnacalcarata TaxID=392030 RepID=A0A816ZSQ0_9BILA|nr:unnamed protein product [Rotaria magnacalcarata]
MFLVYVPKNGITLFKIKLDNLGSSSHYEFSAYFLNVIKQKAGQGGEPNVIFELRASAAAGSLLAYIDVGKIPHSKTLTWLQRGFSFIVPKNPVELVVTIKITGENSVLAIDDIQLRTCSTNHPVSVPPVILLNQPTFCPILSWEPIGTTLTNTTMADFVPSGIFIDNHNIIYVNDPNNSQIQVWNGGETVPRSVKPISLRSSRGIFVAKNGDIYLDIGENNSRVDKWSNYLKSSVPVMSVKGTCYGLFVDRDDNVYCSLWNQHTVVKRSPYDRTYSGNSIAGNGTCGSKSTMLCFPSGIFVDTNFNLYVADYDNHRIQLFEPGRSDARTLVGNDILGDQSLNHPTDIKVDADGNLFIVDHGNHRIVRFGSDGLHCIIGCPDTNGTESHELNSPRGIAFDTRGNIFIFDSGNHRIQKFTLARNICISYNLPKICPNATWNQDGITVVNQTLIGNAGRGIFVDSNNTLYVAAHNKSQILILGENSVSPIGKNVSLTPYTDIFVSNESEIYYEGHNETGQIKKWLKNSNTSVSVASFPGNCYGLFIDHNNSLYCSINTQNIVVKMSLNDNTNTVVNVTGTGIRGSDLDQFSGPCGIFVDFDFTLYVADSGNNRIQSFQLGENNGTAIAGNGTPNNLELNYPTGVVLDADNNLFIADNNNSRIIRVIRDDYRCVVGCNPNETSTSDTLNDSYALRFDSHGNLFVADGFNHRIQKFTIAANSCGNSNKNR